MYLKKFKENILNFIGLVFASLVNIYTFAIVQSLYLKFECHKLDCCFFSSHSILFKST